MSELIIIQDEQISSIKQHGIYYLDNAENKILIDFLVCYANYLRANLKYECFLRHKEINPTVEISFHDYLDTILNPREIGQRNSLGGGYWRNEPYSGTGKPYIVFHTIPYTVIETETREIFFEVVDEIREYDWHLYDET